VDSLLQKLSAVQTTEKQVQLLTDRTTTQQVHPETKNLIDKRNKVTKEECGINNCDSDDVKAPFSFRPIGFVRSCHVTKNGSPRQPTVSPDSRGIIGIDEISDKFNNVEYSLQNLEDFSHVWIIFVFHLNEEGFVKTKVNISCWVLSCYRVQ
jgi:hypothetical protein